MLLSLLILGALAIYIMNPDERTNAVLKVVRLLRQAQGKAAKFQVKSDPFRDALRERTPRIFVAPAIVAMNAGIFVCMLFGGGSLSDPATLVGWGASVGVNTTNGEWWRLVTSLFVHDGFFELVLGVAVVLVLGDILERLVGHLTFAAVYLVSGVVAGLVSLAGDPLTVVAGASSAAFGLCGLLLASLVRGFFRPSPLTIPLRAAKMLGPLAAAFMGLSLISSSEPERLADVIGLGVGLIAAAILVRDIAEQKPAAPRVAAVAGASAVICLMAAIPLAGTTDIRRELKNVLAFEERTAHAYDAAVSEFRKGWIKADTLISLIDGKIRPELAAIRDRIRSAKGMPRAQQTLAAKAEEYFRLRDESWRLRAKALHPPNTKGLRTADRAERASLDLLQEIRQTNLQ